MTRATPTMHPDYPIGMRVAVTPAPGASEVTGYIGGVSFVHAIFVYIVVLDKPMPVPGWDQPWSAIPIPGGLIRPLEFTPQLLDLDQAILRQAFEKVHFWQFVKTLSNKTGLWTCLKCPAITWTTRSDRTPNSDPGCLENSGTEVECGKGPWCRPYDEHDPMSQFEIEAARTRGQAALVAGTLKQAEELSVKQALSAEKRAHQETQLELAGTKGKLAEAEGLIARLDKVLAAAQDRLQWTDR